jgi:hypothetical protein
MLFKCPSKAPCMIKELHLVYILTRKMGQINIQYMGEALRDSLTKKLAS